MLTYAVAKLDLEESSVIYTVFLCVRSRIKIEQIQLSLSLSLSLSRVRALPVSIVLTNIGTAGLVSAICLVSASERGV